MHRWIVYLELAQQPLTDVDIKSKLKYNITVSYMNAISNSENFCARHFVCP